MRSKTFPRCAIVALTLCLAIFFVLEFAYPRFPETDEIAYKSAGRSLVTNGVFAAPELEGFLNLNLEPPVEKVFSFYPPLYPWLFGQLVRVTSFGWQVCVGYDALISAALAVIIYWLANAVLVALLGTSLTFRPALLTLVFRHVARPDELGMMLGFANAAWLLLPSRPAWRGYVSGALAGFMLCTSLGVFLAFVPLLAALWLRAMNDRSNVVFSLPPVLVGGSIATALCLMPLFSVHPHFYSQFIQLMEALNLIEQPIIDRLAENIDHAWQVSRQSLVLLLATLPTVFAGMIKLWRNNHTHDMLTFFAAPLVGFALVFLSYGSYLYWWFLQPWFFVLVIAVVADLFWRSRSKPLALAATGWLVVWIAVASAWPVKDYLIRITLPSDQRLTINVQKLRAIIPTGAQVLTANGWWALGRDRKVYDPGVSDIRDLDRIEYFVTDSNGTGQPGVWARPENRRYDEMLRDGFEIISDMLPNKPVQVFGIRITNSAYGFGSIVMRRIPKNYRSPTPPTNR